MGLTGVEELRSQRFHDFNTLLKRKIPFFIFSAALVRRRHERWKQRRFLLHACYILKPIVVMFVCPPRIVFFPPISIVPTMVSIPVAIVGPFAMMLFHPIGMIVKPPGSRVPFVMLIIITPAMMEFIGMY